jgi:hypothetical protein
MEFLEQNFELANRAQLLKFGIFGFLLSTYEIWKVLVSLAEKNYCRFSRFRTFYTEKTSLE